jgi:hypothetical protein
MQKHWEFQVVTPRTLAQFKGDALILPDARIVSDGERDSLKALVSAGKRLVIAGQNQTQLSPSVNVARFPDDPCKAYDKSLDSNLEKANPETMKDLLTALHHEQELQITASPLVATSFALVDGKPHVFLANFAGLRGGVNAIPTPQEVTLQVPAGREVRVYYLPFLGGATELHAEKQSDRLLFRVPAVQRGAVIWIDDQHK